MTDSVTLTKVEILPNRTRERAEGRRIPVGEGGPKAAGWSNSAMSSGPGWSPIRGFLVRKSPRT